MAAYTNSFLGFTSANLEASIDPKFDANLDYPTQAEMAEAEEYRDSAIVEEGLDSAHAWYDEMAEEAYDNYLEEVYQDLLYDQDADF